MSACPQCGYVESGLEAAQRVLRERAELLGVNVQGKIREANASRLLDKSSETLRDYRKNLEPEVAPIRYYRDGKGNVYYFLEDLAAFSIGHKK